jgi:signal transduction histidine kinase
MNKPTWRPGWYRSLYWRAAFSFVILVTGVVAAQALMSYWLLSRDAAARVSHLDLTLSAAERLGGALAKTPSLDLSEYLHDTDSTGRLFVIMRDGRVAGARTPPSGTVKTVIEELRDPKLTAIPAFWRRSEYSAAAVISDGRLVGVLGHVRPTTVEEYFIPMAVLGLSVLVGGAFLTAVLAFGPTRRRLHDLEIAAHRLEAGDLSARASEAGSDEVSEFSRAFNSMADSLAKSASDQEASARARRQLLADVSHELMTPRTAIRGYLETLAMARVSNDVFTRQKQVAVARREAQRLERLIGDLLDIARFEAGGGHLELSEVWIEDLFERVVEHHEQESQARGIRCDLHVSAEASRIVADPFRIEQALVNVTTNAFRHTPDGGTIRLESKSEGERIVLSVADSGDGIPPEHLPLIFDRFHKVSSGRANPSGGSGLGLSIVKAIIERHGGSVQATSTLGVGTMISLSVPVGLHAAGLRSRVN